MQAKMTIVVSTLFSTLLRPTANRAFSSSRAAAARTQPQTRRALGSPTRTTAAFSPIAFGNQRTGDAHRNHRASSSSSSAAAASSTVARHATALVFDTETTGMVKFRESFEDPAQPDLVQLGFLLVDTRDWRIRNQGSVLVRLRDGEGSGIGEGARSVHGISDEDCFRYGVEPSTALGLFADLCARADVLVGHNLRFDLLVLQTAFYRHNTDDDDDTTTAWKDLLASKRRVCTMMESIDLCKLPSAATTGSSFKWPRLEEAYAFVKRAAGDPEAAASLEGAHDALVDSRACLEIFRYLVEHGRVSVGGEGEETIRSPRIEEEIPKNTIEEEDAAELRWNENGTGTSEREGRAPEEPIPEAPKLFDPASFSSDMVERPSQNSRGGPPSYNTATTTTNNTITTTNNNNNNNNNNGGFRVRGNTYQHKDIIKQLGGRWNGQTKEWVFQDDTHRARLESYPDLTIVRFSDE